MKAHAEHVDAEPRKARDNVAEDSHGHQSSFTNHPAPSCVQDERVPQNDDERAVFFWIPSPESPPRLVSPDAAQDGAEEAKECGKTNDAVNHFGERFSNIERKG